MRIINYSSHIVTVAFMAMIFFVSSPNAEALLGRSRGEVKDRLGDPATRTIKAINGVMYKAGSYVYFIRFDASGVVDRCMVMKMAGPGTFTPQEFKALARSMSTEGFKVIRSNNDVHALLNHKTDNNYLATRAGGRKDWVYMMSHLSDEKADLSFYKAVLGLYKRDK